MLPGVLYSVLMVTISRDVLVVLKETGFDIVVGPGGVLWPDSWA